MYRGYFTEQELNEYLEWRGIKHLRKQLNVQIGDVLKVHDKHRVVIGYHFGYNDYLNDYYRCVVLDNGHHYAEQTAWCFKIDCDDNIQLSFDF